MGQVQLLEKVRKIPPAYQKEVEDFIDALLQKDTPQDKNRVIGLLKGRMKMREDFDEPLEDFKDYM